jgi:kynurenine formamidase
MKFVDLTHTFTNDMPVFPGDPKATLKQTIFIEKDGNNDHTLKTAMHVGTHMDAPLHMLAHGKRIDELSLEHFFGQGVLIDVRKKKKIDVDCLKGVTLKKNSCVLLFTGWSDKFGTDTYFKDYPEITESFAKKLIELKVKMVGLDCPSPEQKPPWTIHKTFLANDILILENLTNLKQLLGKNFEVIALPAKLQADAAPVRVVALMTLT